jgi:hypothetical protein
MTVESQGGMIFTAGTEELRQKSIPVPLFPQIPRGLTQVQTWAFVVRGWQLTAWAIAWLLYAQRIIVNICLVQENNLD